MIMVKQEITSIQVTKEFKKYLKKEAKEKDETYENILRRKLGLRLVNVRE
jgi:hypothetical protein